MKKFRLQSILEYRRSLEEEVQREFVEIQNNLARERELGSEIQHQIAAWQQRFREKQREARPGLQGKPSERSAPMGRQGICRQGRQGRSPCDSSYPAELDLHQKFIHFLITEAERQSEKIRSLELAMDKKRQALLEARREKKVMEKLKEKTLALWEREMLQEEQKALDEKATSQYRGVLDEEE